MVQTISSARGGNGKPASFKIAGMQCFYCFKGAAEILRKYQGIIEVRVGLEKGQALVFYNQEMIDRGRLIGELEKAGYVVG